jgi:hypothetical protein
MSAYTAFEQREVSLGLALPSNSRSYDLIRQRALNPLDRIRKTLSKKVFPASFGVRGDWIAVDYLTEAFK